ncbi:MAG: helix-turn-helix domain-containing protein [Flavisolibacter sp.]|nr:helix-turn-helix domain-containing protein [Flavisolibacter sp.]
MPAKSEPIPVFKPTEVGKHHFGDTEWKPHDSGTSDFFHINRIEDYIQHLKFPLQPHRKTVFDFLFLTRGNSIRTKGLDSYEMRQNTFFFLPPYQITTHESMSADATGFNCHFDSEILLKYYKHDQLFAEFPFLQFIGNPLIQIDQPTVTPVINLLKRIENEYNLKTERFDIISIYLLALLVEVKQFYGTRTRPSENAAFRVTQQYKEALMQFVYDKQSVSDYADLLAVTPNHLNRCIKAVTGKSAQELLSDMIVMEVKALMRQTSLSISEIAFKIGKEDPSDFTRFFKSKTGMPPSEYRQIA